MMGRSARLLLCLQIDPRDVAVATPAQNGLVFQEARQGGHHVCVWSARSKTRIGRLSWWPRSSCSNASLSSSRAFVRRRELGTERLPGMAQFFSFEKCSPLSAAENFPCGKNPLDSGFADRNCYVRLRR
jgi:hypothetical protein